MSNTNLVRCACKSEFQDETYGKGMRLANLTRTGQFRCTVCGAVSGATNLTSQSEKVKVKLAAKTEEKKEPEKKMTKDNKGKSTGKPEKKKSLKGTKR